MTRAEHDALTGLRNHGAFQRELGALVSRRAPFALLMLDLDAFKVYNDTHGHPAGDALLGRIGGVMTESIRGDRPCLPLRRRRVRDPASGADLRRGPRYRGRVRAAVAGLTDTIGPLVTVSVGIAGYPDDGWTKDELVAVADRGCTWRSRQGRRAGDRRSDAGPVPGRGGQDDDQDAGAPRAAGAAARDRGTGGRAGGRQARVPVPARGRRRGGRGPRRPRGHRGVRGVSTATTCPRARAWAGRWSGAADRRWWTTTPRTTVARTSCRRAYSEPCAQSRSRPVTRRSGRSGSRRARRAGRSPSARWRRSCGSPSWRRSPSTTPGCSNAPRPRSARAHAALHDQLTGLPNRTLLLNRLAEQLETGSALAGRGLAPAAIPGARRPGHRRADRADPAGSRPVQGGQREPGPRRRRPAAGPGRPTPAGAARSTDTVARLGSDEFGILLGAVRQRPRPSARRRGSSRRSRSRSTWTARRSSSGPARGWRSVGPGRRHRATC